MRIICSSGALAVSGGLAALGANLYRNITAAQEINTLISRKILIMLLESPGARVSVRADGIVQDSFTGEANAEVRERLGRAVRTDASASPAVTRTTNESLAFSDRDSVSGSIMNFGRLARKRQAAFREGLTPPSDAVGHQHGHLLALGREEENLFPALRGENGACRYFAERGIKWWQATRSGDATDGKRPTRNMASSQIACVNFLLPLVDIPGALPAVLKAIDDDVTGVVDIEHEGNLFSGRVRVDRARPCPGGSFGEDPRRELDERRRLHGR